MPKRQDLRKILVLGAGPIIIGQACEFDYSGVQACKALREEGYHVILINSNPASIMTDPELADATYLEPLTWPTVARIIAQERPDALLPTMGGQTALNCALDLERQGILSQYKVELIGASIDAIQKAEDRQLFKEAMQRIGLQCAHSVIAHSLDEALSIQEQIGFPVIIRPSFTLGGTGGGIAYDRETFMRLCELGFEASPTHELLIEQSMLGWKEFELEVIRDAADNCMIVCAIENFDPMGVHTGDSITVAPTQTLSDKEYQRMRLAAMAILREIGVETGGSNVQFSVCPNTGDLFVIEMNPRVSRSSALASKATGFPIAKIAAKLAIGMLLHELKNDMTGGQTPASFEPTLDYVVVKIPRFAAEKFPNSDHHLSTQMKSVGEVMAIGATFPAALQKALRALETNLSGLDEQTQDLHLIKRELSQPGPERILYVADAFRMGVSLEQIYEYSGIDPWFLSHIQDLIEEEHALQKLDPHCLDAYSWRRLKQLGFSDQRLAYLWHTQAHQVREWRLAHDVRPVYKRVDGCAAEFSAQAAYFYATYDIHCESVPTPYPKIIILGGGPNRIGQGIEFDYCCVHAAWALREAGYETIMINCNPETVSTDYDTTDRLYFEPVTLEDVLGIVEKENPVGVVVHYGGQTPLKLARALEEYGVPILGTSPDAIDRAEDRQRFQLLLNELGLKQPANRIARSMEEALQGAQQLGYPLMVRPSYVLGGRAMEVVHHTDDLMHYMAEAVKVSQDSPILLDRFLNQATEIDVDALSDGQQVIIAGIMQHIEEAGIHSGDSACSLPAFSLSEEVLKEVRQQSIQLARSLGVVGLINIQFALQGNELFVLEANPRASRTIPFVSKATGIAVAKLGARVMAGESLQDLSCNEDLKPLRHCVKESVFPFRKFQNVDTLLGPEMRSTGEVMGHGHSFSEAFYKSQIAAGEALPRMGKIFISLRDSDKEHGPELAQRLLALGFSLSATHGTARYLEQSGIPVESINKVSEGEPHVVEGIKKGSIVLVVNTSHGARNSERDGFLIRREALLHHIPQYTNLRGAFAMCEALSFKHFPKERSLQEWHCGID
jgi:carbamoyl-phosphate synthase large subunit